MWGGVPGPDTRSAAEVAFSDGGCFILSCPVSRSILSLSLFLAGSVAVISLQNSYSLLLILTQPEIESGALWKLPMQCHLHLGNADLKGTVNKGCCSLYPTLYSQT